MSRNMDSSMAWLTGVTVIGMLACLVIMIGRTEASRTRAEKDDKDRQAQGAAYLAQHGIKPVGTPLPEAPAPVAAPAPAPTVTTITVGIQPMTLRQWYAGQALAGMAARTHIDESCVQAAFAIADAMIAEGGE